MDSTSLPTAEVEAQFIAPAVLVEDTAAVPTLIPPPAADSLLEEEIEEELIIEDFTIDGICGVY